MRVQTATQSIRSQPVARIFEDSRRTGPILSSIVQSEVANLQPGMTTQQINTALSAQILSHGLLPSMLGFKGFPAASALSVSPAFLHAPPDEKVISEGDLLTIQVSASSSVSHASIGVTVPIGCPDDEDLHMLEDCRQALQNAVGVVRPGIRTGAISHEIERSLKAANLSPIIDFVGYSMGRERIQSPQILGYGPPDAGEYIYAGMILNIQVIGTNGERLTRTGRDNWTAFTQEGSRGALATEMVLVEESGGTSVTTLPEIDFNNSCGNIG